MKEKKKRLQKEQASRSGVSDDAAEEGKNINLTVHSQPNWGACFPMCGGKQKMTMNVTTAL